MTVSDVCKWLLVDERKHTVPINTQIVCNVKIKIRIFKNLILCFSIQHFGSQYLWKPGSFPFFESIIYLKFLIIYLVHVIKNEKKLVYPLCSAAALWSQTLFFFFLSRLISLIFFLVNLLRKLNTNIKKPNAKSATNSQRCYSWCRGQRQPHIKQGTCTFYSTLRLSGLIVKSVMQS